MGFTEALGERIAQNAFDARRQALRPFGMLRNDERVFLAADHDWISIQIAGQRHIAEEDGHGGWLVDGR